MKNSKFFILGIALLTLLTISCHNKRNKLVNSWKITAVESNHVALTDSAKHVILTSGNLTFTEDGHVTGFLLQPITNGTYALTKKGKSLIIKDETGTPFPSESTITDDELILKLKEVKITLKKI